MIRIREIDHLVLRVVDLDGMLHFYCDVLGCTIERRQDSIGLVQLRAGRSLVDLVPIDGELGGASNSKGLHRLLDLTTHGHTTRVQFDWSYSKFGCLSFFVDPKEYTSPT
jgi:catechol 2,3-dioxygenase-like lactoylglutathione lyase family enzyme